MGCSQQQEKALEVRGGHICLYHVVDMPFDPFQKSLEATPAAKGSTLASVYVQFACNWEHLTGYITDTAACQLHATENPISGIHPMFFQLLWQLPVCVPLVRHQESMRIYGNIGCVYVYCTSPCAIQSRSSGLGCMYLKVCLSVLCRDWLYATRTDFGWLHLKLKQVYCFLSCTARLRHGELETGTSLSDHMSLHEQTPAWGDL